MPPALDDLPVWTQGEACCNDCGKFWTAVWPLGANDLECPQCGSTDTEREEA